MRSSPVMSLPDGPIDVVGDVHGHRAPLERLLEQLGYQADGIHPEGRRLVFVGDLCDRGPDSPGVFELVMTAVEVGGAVCLLGNHELPFIDPDPQGQRKAGNAWYFGDAAALAKDEADFGPCRQATAAQRERIAAFCDRLPIAIEHPALQVVHACWDAASLEFIRGFAGLSNTEIIIACHTRAAEHLARAGLTERYPLARQALQERRREYAWQPDRGVTVEEQLLIDDLVPGEHIEQRENPLKVLTSGPERPAALPRWLGKKWRFLERLHWWEEQPPARPTIFGHYWRQRRHRPMAPYDEHSALFGAARAQDWLGPERLAMCIDYRWPEDWHRPALAALRPDRGELVFWDGERLECRRG